MALGFAGEGGATLGALLLHEKSMTGWAGKVKECGSREPTKRNARLRRRPLQPGQDTRTPHAKAACGAPAVP
jgi:hypothetical protein